MKIKMTKEQIVISNSHSLMLRNIFIAELNSAKEKGNEVLVVYYQREIDAINNHFDSIGFKD